MGRLENATHPGTGRSSGRATTPKRKGSAASSAKRWPPQAGQVPAEAGLPEAKPLSEACSMAKSERFTSAEPAESKNASLQRVSTSVTPAAAIQAPLVARRLRMTGGPVQGCWDGS